MNKRGQVSSLDRAYRFLGRRAHSVHELREKLRSRGYDQSEIENTLLKLLDNGYLDDKKFCQTYAEYRIEKLALGPKKIFFDLWRKGIDEKLIGQTVARLFDSESEMSVALTAAKKKAVKFGSGIERDTMKQKLYKHLLRRGFSPDVSRQVAFDMYGRL